MGIKLTKLGEQMLGTGATVKRTVDVTERPDRRSRTFTARQWTARKKRKLQAKRSRRRNPRRSHNRRKGKR